jgi:hypothetical protein
MGSLARIRWDLYNEEDDLKDPPPVPEIGLYDLRQFSNSCWTAAPHRPQMSNQTNLPELTDKVRPVTDDIVGWPEELAIGFIDNLLSWTTPRQTPPD